MSIFDKVNTFLITLVLIKIQAFSQTGFAAHSKQKRKVSFFIRRFQILLILFFFSRHILYIRTDHKSFGSSKFSQKIWALWVSCFNVHWILTNNPRNRLCQIPVRWDLQSVAVHQHSSLPLHSEISFLLLQDVGQV